MEPTLEALRALLKVTPSGRMDKFVRATGVKAVNKQEFTAEVPISSGNIDRDREIIEPRAFRKAKGTRIPLVDSHTYDGVVNTLGEVMDLHVRDNLVMADTRWLVGKGNKAADWGWVLVQEDLAGFSVGFIPKKWVDADLEDEKVLRDVIAGKLPLRTYTEIELLEVSQVIVPSNRDAVMSAVGKGFLSQQDGEKLLALQPEGVDVLKEFEALLEDKGAPDPKAPVVPEHQKGDNWKVGGARGLPMADDSSWDGAAAESSLATLAGLDGDAPKWSTYRRGFVVYNSGDPEKKGSYKLPFARAVNGELRASKAGLQAVRQRLGSTDVPEDVRSAAERFVNSYLGEPDKAPSQVVLRVAAADADQVVLQDVDGTEVWRGAPSLLMDAALRRTQQVVHTITMPPVEVSIPKFVEVMSQVEAALKANTAEVTKALGELPTMPAHLKDYPTLSELTAMLGAAIARNAADIAEKAIAKVLGDPSGYRR